MVLLFFRYILTGTLLDAEGSKVELLVCVGFGLVDDGIVDVGVGTGLLTHTAVIEVTTCLNTEKYSYNKAEFNIGI